MTSKKKTQKEMLLIIVYLLYLHNLYYNMDIIDLSLFDSYCYVRQWQVYYLITLLLCLGFCICIN